VEEDLNKIRHLQLWTPRDWMMEFYDDCDDSQVYPSHVQLLYVDNAESFETMIQALKASSEISLDIECNDNNSFLGNILR
jgi:hypothetical protein